MEIFFLEKEKKTINQSGGFKKEVQEKMTPMKEDQPFLQLIVNKNPEETKKQIPPKYVPSPYPNLYQVNMPQYLQPGHVFYNPVAPVEPLIYPLNNIINIRSDNPLTNHTTARRIIEHHLPKNVDFTQSTLLSRIRVKDFITTSMIKTKDGQNISFNEGILSKIIPVATNPNKYHLFSESPYEGLPNNLLIYKTCYPLKANNVEAKCSEGSSSICMKLYDITREVYDSIKTNNSPNNYNIWREIRFYEFMREEVLSKNVCPNFVLMYSYYLSQNPGISFSSITDKLYNNTNNNQNKNNNIFKRDRNDTNNYIISDMTLNKIYGNNNIKVKIQEQDDKPKSTNTTKSSGNMITILSECPDYNLLTWASDRYRLTGSIKKQIGSGFHNDDTWMTVFFQLLSSLVILEREKIYLKDMNLHDNVYVKIIRKDKNDDEKTSDISKQHWLYVIDGIEYYIPIPITDAVQVYLDLSCRETKGNNDIEKFIMGNYTSLLSKKCILGYLRSEEIDRINKNINSENMKQTVDNLLKRMSDDIKINFRNFNTDIISIIKNGDKNIQDLKSFFMGCDSLQNKNNLDNKTLTIVNSMKNNSKINISEILYLAQYLGYDLNQTIKNLISFVILDLVNKTKDNEIKVFSSKLFNDNISNNVFNNLFKDNVKNLFNPNNFGNTFITSHGNSEGVIPTTKILDMLTNITRNINNKNIKELIFDNFKNYLNNRIGTPIREKEKQIMNKQPGGEFKKGDMVIYRTGGDEYVWVLYMDNNEILTKNNNIYSKLTVSRNVLYEYSKIEKVDQDISVKDGYILDNRNRKEMYIIE